jgi:hypothetical protein
MTIFHLLVYSCISVNGLDGELLAKTCRWDDRDLYVTSARCEEAGAKTLMSQIFSDVYEDRRVERHKCMPVWVNE